MSYNASTNRRSDDCADAAGNIRACTGETAKYDSASRVVKTGLTSLTYPRVAYAYGPGNQRVWRGVWDTTEEHEQQVDELTYYSVGGAKMVAYDLSVSSSTLRATASGDYYEYFGEELLKNSSGWVNQDRLGSIGKFFPYGQERPSPTTDGKEKFATYFRDDETGLDYAVNRFHDPGDGRFLTPDPLDGSANPGDPGSWNRYAYVGGDPINSVDPQGLYAQAPQPAVVGPAFWAWFWWQWYQQHPFSFQFFQPGGGGAPAPIYTKAQTVLNATGNPLGNTIYLNPQLWGNYWVKI